MAHRGVSGADDAARGASANFCLTSPMGSRGREPANGGRERASGERMPPGWEGRKMEEL